MVAFGPTVDQELHEDVRWASFTHFCLTGVLVPTRLPTLDKDIRRHLSQFSQQPEDLEPMLEALYGGSVALNNRHQF